MIHWLKKVLNHFFFHPHRDASISMLLFVIASERKFMVSLNAFFCISRECFQQIFCMVFFCELLVICCKNKFCFCFSLFKCFFFFLSDLFSGYIQLPNFLWLLAKLLLCVFFAAFSYHFRVQNSLTTF